MQLQRKIALSIQHVPVLILVLAVLIPGLDVVAQEKLQRDKAPAAQKKQGDAGTEADAPGRPELAMPVKLNATYQGSLSAATDKEDIYKFQVKKGSSVIIYLGNDKSSGATIFAEVLYADGKPLEESYDATADPDPGEGEQLIIDNAPAAVLLLRVRSDRAKHSYSFSIKAKLD